MDFAVRELEARRQFSTSDIDRDGLELFRVADALFMPDGRLVVANSGTEELLVISPDGTEYRRLGGKGKGPGEFDGLNALLPYDSGGFLAWDHRFSRYGLEDNFIEILRLDPENRVVSIKPLAMSDDGKIVAVLGEQRYFQTSGERRDTVPLLVFPREHAAPDTVGTWMGLERAFGAIPGRATFIAPIGYARTAFYASNGRQVAIGSTDSLDVSVYGPDLQPKLRIVAPPSNRLVTDADRSAWEEYREAQLPMDREEIRVAWESAPIRETFPGFDGLQLDPLGRLWIGEAITPSASRRRWIRFSEDGRPQAQLHVPAQWSGYLPGRTELLAIASDRFALREEESIRRGVGRGMDVW